MLKLKGMYIYGRVLVLVHLSPCACRPTGGTTQIFL